MKARKSRAEVNQFWAEIFIWNMPKKKLVHERSHLMHPFLLLLVHRNLNLNGFIHKEWMTWRPSSANTIKVASASPLPVRFSLLFDTGGNFSRQGAAQRVRRQRQGRWPWAAGRGHVAPAAAWPSDPHADLHQLFPTSPPLTLQNWIDWFLSCPYSHWLYGLLPSPVPVGKKKPKYS